MNLITKIFLPVVTLSLLLAVYTYFVWIPKSIDSYIDKYIENEKIHLKSTSEAIVPYLISNNLANIYRYLDQLRENHDEWKHIIIYSESNKLLYPFDEIKQSEIREEYTKISNEITVDRTKIAEISLYFDKTYELQVLNKAYLAFWIIVTTIFFIYSLTGISIYYYVIVPIKKLNIITEDFPNSKEKVDFTKAYNDEISILMRSFGSMNDKITNILNDTSEAKIKFEHIMDSILDGIIISDKKGIILSCNNSVETMLGFKEEDIIGSNVNMFIPPSSIKKNHNKLIPKYDKFKDSLRTGYGRSIFAQKKNGTILPVHLSINKIEFKDDIAFISIIHDTSNQKQIELELLENLKVMKKVELEAIRARLEAENANKSKTDFLANMSHEIRTPMNGILGMVELLFDTKLTDEQKKISNAVSKSAQNLMDIINDILDFSKIEAGKFNLVPIEFNLYETIKELLDVLLISAIEKDIKIITRIDKDIPEFVICDQIRVRQLIFNIVGNAIKFTKEGHVFLTVSRAEDTGEDLKLIFKIQDTGIGIPHDKTEYIFEKFSQAEESTVRNFGGTGLGLAICKKIVTLMNGTIKAESVLGQGSVFTFDITVEKSSKKIETPNNNLDDYELDNINILTINDYEPEDQVLSSYLCNSKIKHNSCSTIKDAFKTINKSYSDKKPYDICILNIDLRQENEEINTFCNKISSDKEIDKTKLIFLSHGNQFHKDNKPLKSKAAAIIRKPYSNITLEEVIKLINYNLYKPVNNLPLMVSGAVINHDYYTNNNQTVDKNTNLKGLNILSVDDIKMNLLLVSKILEKSGCIVDSSLDGAEALEKYMNNRYDLIFMDCQMPKMDGYEATKKILEFEKENKLQHTPIVALTASAMRGDREKCLKAGFDDYVNKPIKSTDLIVMIEKWVNIAK